MPEVYTQGGLLVSRSQLQPSPRMQGKLAVDLPPDLKFPNVRFAGEKAIESERCAEARV